MMNLSNRKALFKELQDCVDSWEQKRLLFSYELACCYSLEDCVLTLNQNQTGFYLFISAQSLANSLRVNSFTLTKNDQLENNSPSLYDAALIELVIQGIEIIYSYAHLINSAEVTLLLPKHDAEDLICFKEFFHSISNQITSKGKRTLLELPICSAYYDDFKNQINNLMTEVRQGLWREQKEDPLIREYFKTWNVAADLNFKIPLPLSGKPSAVRNLINFPDRSRQVRSTKVPC